jgi:hypothetical protein
MKNQTKLERAAVRYLKQIGGHPGCGRDLNFIDGARWLARQLKRVSKEGATDHRDTMLAWIDDAMKGEKLK